ncbi:MAG: hypothetical protein MO853_01425 [Candidatus Protistobacter heckmanni]|nr:hypothetical protein [Candidatus Protistobacter heckmanni]
MHAEQGLGDGLQFCRYVPLHAARGAQVIFETPPALQALMRTLDAPGLTVAADGEALPDFDLYCPLLSLPEAFGTRLEAIPSAVPYLHAPEAAAAAWRETLSIPTDGAAERAPRIGLCWAGSVKQASELPQARLALRNIALAQLAPLLALPAQWHSLQK